MLNKVRDCAPQVSFAGMALGSCHGTLQQTQNNALEARWNGCKRLFCNQNVPATND